MNDAELASAAGRVSRRKLAVGVCLLMSPLSVVGSCAGAIAFLQPTDRAFAILPVFVLPVAFLCGAWLARSSLRVAKNELGIARWADDNGLSFRRRAGGKTAAAGVYKMAGDIRWTFHMAGEVGGTRVEFVNRGWRLDIPEVAEAETDQTEVVLLDAVPRDLDFALIPKREDGSIHDLTTGERVRFRDDAEFDRGFVVWSERPEGIDAGLPDRFVTRCLKRREFTVVARHGSLLVFRLNHVFTADGYDALLDHALGLAAALHGR
jgi:hypothetical protein